MPGCSMAASVAGSVSSSARARSIRRALLPSRSETRPVLAPRRRLRQVDAGRRHPRRPRQARHRPRRHRGPRHRRDGRVCLRGALSGQDKPQDFKHSQVRSPIAIRHDDRKPDNRGPSERRPNLRRPPPRRVWSIPSGRRRRRTTPDGWFRTGAGSVRAPARVR